MSSIFEDRLSCALNFEDSYRRFYGNLLSSSAVYLPKIQDTLSQNTTVFICTKFPDIFTV